MLHLVYTDTHNAPWSVARVFKRLIIYFGFKLFASGLWIVYANRCRDIPNCVNEFVRDGIGFFFSHGILVATSYKKLQYSWEQQQIRTNKYDTIYIMTTVCVFIFVVVVVITYTYRPGIILCSVRRGRIYTASSYIIITI